MASDQIVKTDVLKVEIFQMPVIDLSYRLCYRFVEPVPLIWQNDARFSLALNGTTNYTDIMGRFFLGKYKEMIQQSKHLSQWNEEFNWLEGVNKVLMINCKLVPEHETQYNFYTEDK